MSTSYFQKQRKEGSPVKLGWNNTFTQQETFETTVMVFPSGRTWLEQRKQCFVKSLVKFEKRGVARGRFVGSSRPTTLTNGGEDARQMSSKIQSQRDKHHAREGQMEKFQSRDVALQRTVMDRQRIVQESHEKLQGNAQKVVEIAKEMQDFSGRIHEMKNEEQATRKVCSKATQTPHVVEEQSSKICVRWAAARTVRPRRPTRRPLVTRSSFSSRKQPHEILQRNSICPPRAWQRPRSWTSLPPTTKTSRNSRFALW